MADNQPQAKMIPMSGKLVTAADGAGIGENFQVLKNMRYSPNGIRGISGMSKINSTALSTYLKCRSGYHFRKTYPAAESHILVQAKNSGGTASQVLENTTEVPSAGDFSGTAVHSDSAGSGLGRFSESPGGQVIYCNGKESLVWGGDENPNAGFIVYDPAGSFSYDYTEETTNLSTDSYASLSNSSPGIDANTMLLLHLDNDVTDSSPATAHTVTNNNVTFDAVTYKFGTHSAVFNGTNANLTVPDNADFDFSGGTFTIDAWINVSDLSADRPIYFQDAPSGSKSHFIVQSDGSLHFSIYSSGSGSEVVTLTSATGLITTGTWYHVAVVESGDIYLLFINGSIVAASSDTDRVDNLSSPVEIGSDSDVTAWFAGRIDELRVSNSARWTSSFTPPVAPYSASTDSAYFYLGSLVPLNGFKIYVGTANTASGTMSVMYWDGSNWASVSSLSDGTASGGVSLSQNGEVTFSDTALLAKQKHIESKSVYWYQVSITAVDSATTITFASALYSMQTIPDIWDGIYYTPISCQYEASSGAITDNSINVYTEDYSSANTASFMNIGGMTSASQFYVGFTERQTGLFFVLPAVNTNSSVMTVSYWNGGEWVAVSGLSDDTSKNGKTFAQSGLATWDAVDSSSEFVKKIARGLPLYYYKVTVSATLSATVRVDSIGGIRAPEDIPGFKFAFKGQDRVWLCSQTDKDQNMARCSARDTFSVWNGDDTVKMYFGDNTSLTAGARLYSQFGSTLLDLMVFFKEHETWLVSGGGPSSWVKFPAGLSIGCVAPLTLVTAHVSAAVTSGINTHVAIFQAADGIYMFDGRNFTRLSNDIENFFNPNADDTINESMKSESKAFYDENGMEYHWLFASGSSTTLNREFVFSVKYNKWYEIDRGKYLQIGINVKDTSGNNYIYGALDTGYLERLENGTTMDGSSITYTVKHGDIFLSDNPGVETMVHRITLGLLAKTNTTSEITGSYFVNTVAAEKGSSFTLDTTDASRRVMFPTTSMPRQKGILHSWQWQITTDDETVGFEPLYATAIFTTERTHRNGV